MAGVFRIITVHTCWAFFGAPLPTKSTIHRATEVADLLGVRPVFTGRPLPSPALVQTIFALAWKDF